MAAPPDASFGHFGKQSFHEVQPTTAGRGVVDVIARVARQPPAYLGDLVRAIVVHDQMDVEPAGEVGVDIIEKPQELLMSVPPVATADRNAAGHIHSRKQRSNAVPFIVLRLSRWQPGRERQY